VLRRTGITVPTKVSPNPTGRSINSVTVTGAAGILPGGCPSAPFGAKLVFYSSRLYAPLP